MNTVVLELWFLADSKRAACQGWNWRTPWKSAHHGCPKNLPAVYRILWTIWKKVSGEENCTNNDQEVKWRIGTLNLFVQIKGVQLSEHKGGRLCERLPPVHQACVEAGQKTFRNLIKVWSVFNASMANWSPGPSMTVWSRTQSSNCSMFLEPSSKDDWYPSSCLTKFQFYWITLAARWMTQKLYS